MGGDAVRVAAALGSLAGSFGGADTGCSAGVAQHAQCTNSSVKRPLDPDQYRAAPYSYRGQTKRPKQKRVTGLHTWRNSSNASMRITIRLVGGVPPLLP